jgi:hypothetical protein
MAGLGVSDVEQSSSATTLLGYIPTQITELLRGFTACIITQYFNQM